MQNTLTTQPKLSPEIETLLDELESLKLKSEPDEEDPKVHIEMTTGKAALYYEKLRNTVGYQEEQMLRRLAISRIIARRARFDREEKLVATGLVWELIQAGYLKNDEVPEEKIQEVVNCLKKYSSIEKQFPPKWHEHFFGIIGSEIESILIDSKKEEDLVNTFHGIILRHMFDEQKESENFTQISECLYISLVQLFLKLDKSAIRYHALKFHFPNWLTLSSQDAAANAKKIHKFAENIESNLLIIQTSQFPKIAKKYYPLYIILRSITQNDPVKVREILLSKQKLTININKITSDYFSNTLAKLNRSILKAVIFILLTKVTLALIFEIPYDRYLHGVIHYQPLIINIIFPPLLMFISVSLITIPGSENSKKITEMAKRFLYDIGVDEKEKQKYNYILLRSRSLTILLSAFYALTFIVSIVALIYLLNILKFSIVSGFLFFFFLSAVSFLAFRIRKSATDLTVSTERENAFVTILDFLLLPFLKIGHWLSRKFEKANFVVFIFDFVLEMPFKTVLEAIEHWIAFMKEKKDEIVL